MKLNNKIIIFVIIDIILVFAIIFIINKKILPERNDVVSSTTHTVTSYNGVFEITVPNSLKIPEQRGKLNEAADLELIDNANLYYCIFIMENKLDLNLNYNEFANISYKIIEDTYNTKVDKKYNIDINGYHTSYTKLNSKLGEDEISMYAYILETKNYYGKCLIWSSINNSNELDKITNDIVKNFKEL